MKLKNLLVLAFLALTLVPVIIVSLLLYKSGLDLSTESYTQNLTESIVVQEDYVSQSIENDMVYNYRFAYSLHNVLSNNDVPHEYKREKLLTKFQAYLESVEDKIAVSILLDKENEPAYTIGEKGTLQSIRDQLSASEQLTRQTLHEFELSPGVHTLGIITPIRDWNGDYLGCFVSVYSKHYLFKSISSYYKVANSSIYICRKNGDIINSRQLADAKQNGAIQKALADLPNTPAGHIDTRIDGIPVLGYFTNIRNTPWYLVGFIDDSLIYTFTNQFVLVYIFIIMGVFIADLLLAIYFSKKVVAPINALIDVMDGYQNRLTGHISKDKNTNDYFEIEYLRKKFFDLMNTILLVQHNFEGIYQLYQSNDMGDINIDIDAKNQVASSNKPAFQALMDEVEVPEGACVVERFVYCFCEKDRKLLMAMFEHMRDEHLSTANEAEIYTPYLGQKWFHVLTVPMYEDDRLSRLFIQLRDISSFKKQEHKSMELSRRDPLTGLYNRSGFTVCVSTILDAHEARSFHGLLFIDMDYFKLVNDNLGHSVGDDLLCSVGVTLQETTCEGSIVSRFGGDEFAVFLPNTNQEQIEEIRKQLSERLIFPFQTDKLSFVVSASIGCSVWSSEAPCSLDVLLRKADEDMYDVKRLLKQDMKKAPMLC